MHIPGPCHSKYGPWTSNDSITWELTHETEKLRPTLDLVSQNLSSYKTPPVICVPMKIRSMTLAIIPAQ